MSIDTHVTRCACKAFVFPIRYVLVSIQVYVFFGQPKIDDMNNFIPLSRTSSNKEILGLDITINQMSTVYVFYPMKLLNNIGVSVILRLSRTMTSRRCC